VTHRNIVTLRDLLLMTVLCGYAQQPVAEAEGTVGVSRHTLARSGVINVAGVLVPVAVAVAAIPLLLHGLGRDRFGVLTLAWATVGWFSVFDLGLGRATTHVVATEYTRGHGAHARSMALMTIEALFGLGCVAGVLAAVTTSLLISNVLHVPSDLRPEARTAFFILCTSLPFVLGSLGARGALEGLGYFGWVNAIRVPAAVLLVAVPVALLPITHDLRPIVATITLNRVCAFVAFHLSALRALGPKVVGKGAPTELVKRTFSYAGWTGATNVFGTILAWGYLDRYVVGAVLTVSSVAVYATPLEIVTKLSLYPMALMAVFFPALARSNRINDGRIGSLVAGALRAAVLPLMPLVMGGVAASKALLSLYIGPDFAREASVVTQLLLLGAFSECVAQVPFTVLQACGRSDLTAKRHMAQLVVYVPVVIGMTSWFGIKGTAITWLAWAISDTALLFYMARRYVGRPAGASLWLSVGLSGLVMLSIAVVISAVTSGWFQITGGVLLCTVGAVALWFSLPGAERQALRALLDRHRVQVTGR
jgi:O-antigen/teichoic acid export membrane protein